MSSSAYREHRSLAASSGLILAGRFTANFGFFVGVLVIARALGPHGRGGLAFLTTATLVVAAFAGFGIAAANSVFVPQRPDQRPRLLTNALLFVGATSLGLGSLIFGALIAFSGLGPGSASDLTYAVCILATGLSALSDTGLGFLIATNRALSFALTIVVFPWLYAVLLVAMALLGTIDTQSAFIMWAVSWTVSSGVAIWAASRGVGFGRPDMSLLRESIHFGFRAWIGNLADFLNFRFDQILMAYLSTQAALGLYATAVNGAEILLIVPITVGLLLTPYVARIDDGKHGPAVLQVFRETLVVTVLVMLVGAIAGPVLIPLVFGAKFEASVTPFLVLLPGTVGFVMIRLFSSALVGSSRPGRASVASLVALATGIALDLILIPVYGATGAAVAVTVSSVAAGILAAALYRGCAEFHWREIVPGSSDLRGLYLTARRLAPGGVRP
jgi:O-antigen/teichoic acid export membrane protein